MYGTYIGPCVALRMSFGPQGEKLSLFVRFETYCVLVSDSFVGDTSETLSACRHVGCCSVTRQIRNIVIEGITLWEIYLFNSS